MFKDATTANVYPIPYPERTGPQALSSVGPSPSEPPLKLESGRTPLHQNCPTLVRDGRLEACCLLLGGKNNINRKISHWKLLKVS